MGRKADFSKLVIYKIRCNDPLIIDFYVGSTTCFKNRKNQHKTDCEKGTQKIYQTIRENGGWSNWTMVEIEIYPCNSSVEARIREEYWRNELQASLNMYRAYCSEQERKSKQRASYESNKETINSKQRANYEANKEVIKIKSAQYRQENKDEINAKARANYEANKEEINAKRKEFRQANKEEINAKYQENKDEINAKARANYESNKEKINERARANYQKRKEKLKALQNQNKDNTDNI